VKTHILIVSPLISPRCCICDVVIEPHEARYPYFDGEVAHPKCAHDETFAAECRTEEGE
jgi:hypothetical protein